MRLDPVLLIALAFVGGGYLATSVLPTLLTATCLGVSVLASGASRPLQLLAVAGAFALGGLRAHATLATFQRERVELRDWIGAPKRCAAQGEVVTSPTVRDNAPSFAADVSSLDCEGTVSPRPVRVQLTGGPLGLARGDRFQAVLQLAPVQAFYNSELLDPGPRLARRRALLSGSVLSLELSPPSRGLYYWMDRARARVRARIEATFSPGIVPMAKALVLGDNDLDAEDTEAFRKGGLLHLLAVSGTHLVFAVLGLLKALRFVLVRVEVLAARFDVGRGVAALGAILAPLYADFAGGSGSAWRAAWMLSAALMARAGCRHPLASRSIAASLIVAGVLDPLVAYDVSFLLSLTATVGLLTLGRRLSRLVGEGESRVIRFLGHASAATLASMAPCVPLLVLLSPALSLASVGANVIAAPLGEAVALPLCLLHAVLGPLPMLELGVARVASGALVCIERVAYASASVGWLSFDLPVPSVWQLNAIVAGVGGSMLCRARPWQETNQRRVGLESILGHLGLISTLGILALFERAQLQQSKPHGWLRVTALDVGQGDASVVDLPEGQLMLIDAGGLVGTEIDPGRLVVEPLLRARRRRKIDIMVLSHPHPDHFLGLLKVAEDYAVGEFWDTGQGEALGAGPAYARLLATLRNKQVPIKRPSELCGSHRIGGTTVEVLAPCPGFDPALGANNNSFVLRIAYGHEAALLVGDAEREEERRLLVTAPLGLAADFLKVGHHGSRSSTTPRFLRAVSPRVATISCGVRNRFGHPHQETLATLRAFGVPSLRLDRLGSITWRTNGIDQEITGFSHGH